MKFLFQCEICGSRSENRKHIEDCEALGVPNLALCPPIGLMVGDNCGPGVTDSGIKGSPRCSGPKWNEGKPCNSHLCGAGFIWVVQGVGVSNHDSHEYRVGFGNFRGNGAGDTFSFGRKDAGGYDPFHMGRSKYSPEKGFRRWQEWPEAQRCPALWRAVKALRDHRIQPMVLRNGEAVAFNEPLPAEYEDAEAVQ